MPSEEQQVSAVLRALVGVVVWRHVSKPDIQKTLETAQGAMWDNIAKQKVVKKAVPTALSLLKPSALKQSGSLRHDFKPDWKRKQLFTNRRRFRAVQQPASNEFKYP